jgi:hypothetical protein
MSDEPDNGEATRRLRIIVAVYSIAILAVMFTVRTCLTYTRVNTISTRVSKAHPRQSAEPGAGRTCLVTSKPGGATVYALREDGREALGVTPVDVGQGDHRILLELSGYSAVEVPVGIRDGSCTIHRELELEAEYR